MRAFESNPSANPNQNESEACLPIAKNEDVEYSEELADADDRAAQHRAEEAEQRQEASCQPE